jgi:hypothetical protein
MSELDPLETEQLESEPPEPSEREPSEPERISIFRNWGWIVRPEKLGHFVTKVAGTQYHRDA